MADVDIAPNFGAELKVSGKIVRLEFSADAVRKLGCLQASQCLGGQRNRMAR
jgi:hypothetical protein